MKTCSRDLTRFFKRTCTTVHSQQTLASLSRWHGSSGGGVLGTSVYVWGNLNGTSLGLGEDDADMATPTLLPAIDDSGFRDISVGTNHMLLATGKGEVYSFGKSAGGQLGLGEEISVKTSLFGSVLAQSGVGSDDSLVKSAQRVEMPESVVKVSSGAWHSAAIGESGALYTWGWGGKSFGSAGGLGHGNKHSLNCPKKVEAFASQRIVDVSCGERHTLAVNDTGHCFAFGCGQHGKLGTGTTHKELTPRRLEYFNDIFVTRVEAAKEFSFALCDKGIAYGWGRNDRNQMGQGAALTMDMYSCDPVPGPVAIESIVDLSLSAGDVLCVDSEGWVYGWGDRMYLEPTAINDERFQDELPIGKIDKAAVAQGFMAFATDRGELFTCSKKAGIQADVFVLGLGAVEPFKIARKVTDLTDKFVTKMSVCDSKMAVIVK